MEQLERCAIDSEKVGYSEPLNDLIPSDSAQATPAPFREVQTTILNHRRDFETSFGSAFLDLEEDSKIQKARAILGEVAKDMPDEELATYLTMFQYLLDSWLDQYETELFDGLTLQQVLRERR